MNVNIKVTLTEAERNLIACKLAGKNRKTYKVSRAEVRELVAGFVEGLLSDLEDEHSSQPITSCSKETATFASPPKPDLSAVPRKYQDKPVTWQVGWLRGWNKVAQKQRY